MEIHKPTDFDPGNSFPKFRGYLRQLGKGKGLIGISREPYPITHFGETSVAALPGLAKDVSWNGRKIGRLRESHFPYAVFGFDGMLPNVEVPFTIARWDPPPTEIDKDGVVWTKNISISYFRDGIPFTQNRHRSDNWWPTIPLP